MQDILDPKYLATLSDEQFDALLNSVGQPQKPKPKPYVEPMPARDIGFMEGNLKKAWGGFGTMAGGALGLVGDLVGSDAIKDYGLGAAEGAQMYNRDIDQRMITPETNLIDTYEKQGLLEAAKATPQFIAEQAVQNLPMMIGTGGVGGFVGKQTTKSLLLKELSKKGLAAEAIKEGVEATARKHLGEDVLTAIANKGGLAARGATGAQWSGLESGSIYVDQPIDQKDPLKALLYGTAAGMIEPLPEAAAIMRSGLGKKILTGVGKGGAESLGIAGKNVAVDILKQAPLEGVQEMVQTGLEQAGAHKDPFTEESFKEQVAGGIAGMGIGGAFGGATSTYQNFPLKKKIVDNKTEVDLTGNPSELKEEALGEEIGNTILNNTPPAAPLNESLSANPKPVKNIFKQVAPVEEDGYADSFEKMLPIDNQEYQPKDAWRDSFETYLQENGVQDADIDQDAFEEYGKSYDELSEQEASSLLDKLPAIYEEANPHLKENRLMDLMDKAEGEIESGALSEDTYQALRSAYKEASPEIIKDGMSRQMEIADIGKRYKAALDEAKVYTARLDAEAQAHLDYLSLSEQPKQAPRKLEMQPDNIEKIKSGAKTATTRTYPIKAGDYSLPDGTKVVVERDTKPIWFKDLKNPEAYAKAEGFESVADMRKNAKFPTTKQFLDGKIQLHVAKLKLDETPIAESKAKRNIAVIGTAGRDKTRQYTLDMWKNMVSDSKSHVSKSDNLVSGGAAWADHLAVRLFLDGDVSGLTLHLPAPIKNGKFVGGYKTAGGTAQYYHDQFKKNTGINGVAEIEEAIKRGAKATYQPEGSPVSAMFTRNKLVAKESDAALAYTFGEDDVEDGGTKNTWDQISSKDKKHRSIHKLGITETKPSTAPKTIFPKKDIVSPVLVVENGSENVPSIVSQDSGTKNMFKADTKNVGGRLTKRAAGATKEKNDLIREFGSDYEPVNERIAMLDAIISEESEKVASGKELGINPQIKQKQKMKTTTFGDGWFRKLFENNGMPFTEKNKQRVAKYFGSDNYFHLKNRIHDNEDSNAVGKKIKDMVLVNKKTSAIKRLGTATTPTDVSEFLTDEELLTEDAKKARASRELNFIKRTGEKEDPKSKEALLFNRKIHSPNFTTSKPSYDEDAPLLKGKHKQQDLTDDVPDNLVKDVKTNDDEYKVRAFRIEKFKNSVTQEQYEQKKNSIVLDIKADNLKTELQIKKELLSNQLLSDEEKQEIIDFVSGAREEGLFLPDMYEELKRTGEVNSFKYLDAVPESVSNIDIEDLESPWGKKGGQQKIEDNLDGTFSRNEDYVGEEKAGKLKVKPTHRYGFVKKDNGKVGIGAKSQEVRLQNEKEQQSAAYKVFIDYKVEERQNDIENVYDVLKAIKEIADSGLRSQDSILRAQDVLKKRPMLRGKDQKAKLESVQRIMSGNRLIISGEWVPVYNTSNEWIGLDKIGNEEHTYSIETEDGKVKEYTGAIPTEYNVSENVFELSREITPISFDPSYAAELDEADPHEMKREGIQTIDSGSIKGGGQTAKSYVTKAAIDKMLELGISRGFATEKHREIIEKHNAKIVALQEKRDAERQEFGVLNEEGKLRIPKTKTEDKEKYYLEEIATENRKMVAVLLPIKANMLKAQLKSVFFEDKNFFEKESDRYVSQGFTKEFLHALAKESQYDYTIYQSKINREIQYKNQELADEIFRDISSGDKEVFSSVANVNSYLFSYGNFTQQERENFAKYDDSIAVENIIEETDEEDSSVKTKTKSKTLVRFIDTLTTQERDKLEIFKVLQQRLLDVVKVKKFGKQEQKQDEHVREYMKYSYDNRAEILFTDKEESEKSLLEKSVEQFFATRHPDEKVSLGKLRDQSQQTFFEKFAKTFGAELVVIRDYREKHKQFQGKYFVSKSGKPVIIVNANGTSFGRVFAHELFHHIVNKANPKEYQAFKDAVLTNVPEHKFEEAIEKARTIWAPLMTKAQAIRVVSTSEFNTSPRRVMSSDNESRIKNVEIFVPSIDQSDMSLLSDYVDEMKQSDVDHIYNVLSQEFENYKDGNGYNKQRRLAEKRILKELPQKIVNLIDSIPPAKINLDVVANIVKIYSVKKKTILYSAAESFFDKNGGYVSETKIRRDDTSSVWSTSTYETGIQSVFPEGLKQELEEEIFAEMFSFAFNTKDFWENMSNTPAGVSLAQRLIKGFIDILNKVLDFFNKNIKQLNNGIFGIKGLVAHDNWFDDIVTGEEPIKGTFSLMYDLMGAALDSNTLNSTSFKAEQIDNSKMLPTIEEVKDHIANHATYKKIFPNGINSYKDVMTAIENLLSNLKTWIVKNMPSGVFTHVGASEPVKKIMFSVAHGGMLEAQKAFGDAVEPHAKVFDKMTYLELEAFVDDVTKNGLKNVTLEQKDALLAMQKVADQTFAKLQRYFPYLQQRENHFGLSIKWLNKDRTLFEDEFEWEAYGSKLEGNKRFMKEKSDLSIAEIREKYNLDYETIHPQKLFLRYVKDAHYLMNFQEQMKDARKEDIARYFSDQKEAMEAGYVPVNDNALKVFQRMGFSDGYKIKLSDGTYYSQNETPVYFSSEYEANKVAEAISDAYESVEVEKFTPDKLVKVAYFDIYTEVDGKELFVSSAKTQKEAERIAKANPDYFIKERIASQSDSVIAQMYFKPDMAKMMNSLLSQDGFKNFKAFGVSGAQVMDLKNIATSMELAFSMFHAFTIGQESISSYAAWQQGLKKLGFGDGVGVASYNPIKVVAESKKIVTLMKDALKQGNTKDILARAETLLGIKNPDVLDIMKQYYNAGGMLGQDSDLRGSGADVGHVDYSSLGSFFNSFKETYNKEVKEFKQKNPDSKIKFGASISWDMFKYTAHASSAWLMEEGIPKIKMAQFAREYSLKLEQHKEEIASGIKTKEQIAIDTILFIEDRFGEVNWKNKWLDATYKTSLQFAFRSFTWIAGTYVALGKVMPEYARLGWFKLKGEEYHLTEKGLWGIHVLGAHIFTAALLSSVYTIGAALGGDEQETDEDTPWLTRILFPRIDPYDNTRRLSVPSYVTEFYKIASHLGYGGNPVEVTKLISGRFNSLLSKSVEIAKNEDFRGTLIRNPKDSIVGQTADVLLHIIPLPISWGTIIKDAQKEGFKPQSVMTGLMGFTDAPASAKRSVAENTAFALRNKETGSKVSDAEDVKNRDTLTRAMAAYSNGDKSQVEKLLAEGRISTRQFQMALERTPIINKKPNPMFVKGIVRQIERLTIDSALDVIEVANEKQIKELRPHIIKKYSNMLSRQDKPREEKKKITARMKELGIIK